MNFTDMVNKSMKNKQYGDYQRKNGIHIIWGNPLVDEEPSKECYTRYCGLCDCRISIHTGGQCHVYELDDGSYVGYIE